MKVVPLLALLLTTSALAKPKPRGNPEAAALIAKARELAKAKDHLGAAAAYKQAYLKDPKSDTLLAQAMELQDAGLEVDAYDTFQAYLKHPGADRVLWRKVQLVVADLQARLGSLRIELDRAADISIDGRFLGEGMLVATTRVMAGEHTILAQRPGFQDTTVRTTVIGDEERLVRISLANDRALAPAVVPTPPVENAAPEPTWTQDDLAAPTSLQDPAPPAALEAKWTPGEGGSSLWVSARAETDLRAGAMGPTLGAGVGLGPLLGLEAMAMIQRATGVRAAASLRFFRERPIRPLVRVGVPVFFDDGDTAAGLHASAGAIWEPVRRIGLVADIGVEHYFDPPGKVRSTTVLLALGLQAEVL